MSNDPTARRIYLDNAATSWPKPDEVYAAVDRYQRELGAPAGRSGYAEATQVSQGINAARRAVARLLGVDDAARVIFTCNGTDSLNLALHGVLREGDHVVTTVIEHNSVLRPLDAEARQRRITVTHVDCDRWGVIDPDAIRAAIGPRTRLIAVSHASNVTGAIQPIADIGRIAHEAGALMLCDAAQTLGHMPVDVRELEVDLLAGSGHKGLLGPLGTGVLALAPGIAERLQSVRQGGTGTRSERPEQPDELPSKYESGNLNVPGILGLGAGVEYLLKRGLDDVERHGLSLAANLLGGFAEIPGLRVLGPATAETRVPLVSIVLEGYDPQEIAIGLDAAHRVQVRAGLHCAPRMHEALETQAGGGTVRFSLGPFNTAADVDVAVRAVAEIAASGASM
ncbi:MAG: cysteine desulfurase [Pirellulales bacterium]